MVDRPALLASARRVGMFLVAGAEGKLVGAGIAEA